MELRINLALATETQIFWIKEMLQREIEDARGAAENEHIWALGSEDEEATQHEENAEENLEYADMLEDALKALD